MNIREEERTIYLGVTFYYFYNLQSEVREEGNTQLLIHIYVIYLLNYICTF